MKWAGIGRVDRLFAPLAAASLVLPPDTGTWRGALTAFFWGAHDPAAGKAWPGPRPAPADPGTPPRPTL